MQNHGPSPGFGPRPPYHPGMQQGGWQQQQQQQQPPMHHQQPGNFQQSFYAGGQQYALVPLHGGPAMMNSPQHHGMPLMGTGFGHSPGIASPQMLGVPAFAPGMSGFNGSPGVGPPPLGGASSGGRGMGARPPPGQPGRGAGRGQGRGAGRGPSPGRAGRATPPGPSPTPPSSGMSKDQRRNAKAMAKLDKQVEAEKPRVYRPLGEEDRLEAARWQAERRKHYPTAANVTRKSEAVAEREARGELEPETALRRKRLQEVLMRQRELGLQQLAGTADMTIDGHPSPFIPGTGARGGRGGRGGKFGGRAGRSPGRGFGRSPGGRHPSNKRPMDFGLEGQQADKRHKPANEGAAANGQNGGLASLLQYGSDDDGNEEAERPDGASADQGIQNGSDQQGQGAAPSATPQTPEEKQALYLKHKAQYERQQQQHQAAMEKRKKAQEKWESKGRGRGRGRNAAGRGQGGRQADRPGAQQAKRAPTLLQKLLVKDIRKDHSHLLQCFRFFVKNNFLQDVGATPLVYPDPPPTLREVLPPVQDGDESLASDSDGDKPENCAEAAPSAILQSENGASDEETSEEDSDE
ncbi:MAG: hypothetical protein FRX49_09470 [Trebouxia sp. A1-2]|nr:MAG: hypothetical protein FRX49_09470 [Trebouxia sp. A1-2]